MLCNIIRPYAIEFSRIQSSSIFLILYLCLYCLLQVDFIIFYFNVIKKQLRRQPQTASKMGRSHQQHGWTNTPRVSSSENNGGRKAFLRKLSNGVKVDEEVCAEKIPLTFH